MTKRTFVAATVVCAALATSALAQYGSAKTQQLAGTYMIVSVVQTNADGTKVDVFGKKPLGSVILTADGNYSVVLVKDDLPKFKKGARLQGTPEENTAVVQGSLAYTGTYTAENGVLTMKVLSSTFPGWTGETQKRKYTMQGDELQWVGITAVQGASVVLTAKRAK